MQRRGRVAIDLVNAVVPCIRSAEWARYSGRRVEYQEKSVGRAGMNRESALFEIKLLHTVIWFLLASCVLALPVAGLMRRFRLAAGLAMVVLLEGALLACNHFRCPLTDLAGHYTTDRGANFDIFLPVWLARNNQKIFGALFVVGGVFVLWKWAWSRRG